MNTYKGSISDWLDDYSEAVAKRTVNFDYDNERPLFNRFFALLAQKLGAEAFVKHKTGRALGGLAPAYFDAVTMGILPLADRPQGLHPSELRRFSTLPWAMRT